jgi:aspartyl aminopeptidase
MICGWFIYRNSSFKDSKENKSTKVMVCMDNEEIGIYSSRANSALILNILERITLSLGKDRVRNA